MFSVVIPVRDKPHTIERTLDSLFAQSFTDFEAFLVGDPADRSLAMAARRSDPRLRIIHQVNCGPGSARNAGLAASRCDWIAFLDADDIWLPNHLAELDAIRASYPDAGLIGTSYIVSDRNGRFQPPANDRVTIARTDFFRSVGNGLNFLFTSSAAVRREVVDSLGGFANTNFGEDTEFWVRIAFALPVATSTRATAVYVRGTGGITDSGRDRWSIAPLASARDLSPAVGLAIDRYPSIESARVRRSVDLFIRRYFDWCLKTSISRGDVRTIRELRRIYWGRPTARHRLLLATAMLPDRPARALYSIGLRVKHLARQARILPSGP
jgi:glycosyltransferase involved in cell wall biosynthesis